MEGILSAQIAQLKKAASKKKQRPRDCPSQQGSTSNYLNSEVMETSTLKQYEPEQSDDVAIVLPPSRNKANRMAFEKQRSLLIESVASVKPMEAQTRPSPSQLNRNSANTGQIKIMRSKSKNSRSMVQDKFRSQSSKRCHSQLGHSTVGMNNVSTQGSQNFGNNSSILYGANSITGKSSQFGNILQSNKRSKTPSILGPGALASQADKIKKRDRNYAIEKSQQMFNSFIDGNMARSQSVTPIQQFAQTHESVKNHRNSRRQLISSASKTNSQVRTSSILNRNKKNNTRNNRPPINQRKPNNLMKITSPSDYAVQNNDYAFPGQAETGTTTQGPYTAVLNSNLIRRSNTPQVSMQPQQMQIKGQIGGGTVQESERNQERGQVQANNDLKFPFSPSALFKYEELGCTNKVKVTRLTDPFAPYKVTQAIEQKSGLQTTTQQKQRSQSRNSKSKAPAMDNPTSQVHVKTLLGFVDSAIHKDEEKKPRRKIPHITATSQGSVAEEQQASQASYIVADETISSRQLNRRGRKDSTPRLIMPSERPRPASQMGITPLDLTQLQQYQQQSVAADPSPEVVQEYSCSLPQSIKQDQMPFSPKPYESHNLQERQEAIQSIEIIEHPTEIELIQKRTQNAFESQKQLQKKNRVTEQLDIEELHYTLVQLEQYKRMYLKQVDDFDSCDLDQNL